MIWSRFDEAIESNRGTQTSTLSLSRIWYRGCGTPDHPKRPGRVPRYDNDLSLGQRRIHDCVHPYANRVSQSRTELAHRSCVPLLCVSAPLSFPLPPNAASRRRSCRRLAFPSSGSANGLRRQHRRTVPAAAKKGRADHRCAPSKKHWVTASAWVRPDIICVRVW